MIPHRATFTSLAVGLSMLLVTSTTVASDTGASDRSAVSPTAEIERRKDLERFALKLLNCNRTGGKIRRNGTCKAYGKGRFSAFRKPLERHRPIGTRVAWPWVRTMIVENECKHVLDGYPGVSQRYANAGYAGAAWGENIGCTWGYTPRDMVIWVSRAFQAEKSDNGGHWRNLKSKSFKSVGIAVAVSGNRASIVFDFYGKRP